MMRVVELFAGIGAQRMALALEGIPHEVVAISEIDRHALASYEAIYGDCPNLGDITKIDRLPPCDLVTYSFPCQDLSLAGKRAGMGEGTRSGLVWEVVRLLETAGERERPEWLLMENVPQVLTSPLWGDLVGRLSAMGYRSKWAKLDSSRFGSAQKRVRAFMVSRMGQDPPDLPSSAPNAPRLCLRDVMEPERAERYVKRIPLDRVRWRTPKEGYRHPQSEGIECRLIDAGDPRLETRRIASEDSLCPALRTGCPQKAVEEEEERVRPLVGTVDNLRMAPKGRKAIGTVRDGETSLVTAPSDGGPGTGNTIMGIDSELSVIGEINDKRQWKPHRYILDPDGPSRTVLAATNAEMRSIKVVADWDRPQCLRMSNRLYPSSSSLSPTLVTHKGGDRDIKVVADDTSIGYELQARIYSKNGASPTVTDLGRRGKEFFKVMDSEDRGDLVVNILTPRECWRLMGFPDWAYDRAAEVSSPTQLYNQAGNSIVVEVLRAIFRRMAEPTEVQTSIERWLRCT